eukprot:GHVS01047131.1.p1 GENE.GHVS01047131.1~~GHVS01047131.1.p1  ORF type:complete len:700 (+),score=94.32 GHVS01047131.1:306-2102(+)
MASGVLTRLLAQLYKHLPQLSIKDLAKAIHHLSALQPSHRTAAPLLYTTSRCHSARCPRQVSGWASSVLGCMEAIVDLLISRGHMPTTDGSYVQPSQQTDHANKPAAKPGGADTYDKSGDVWSPASVSLVANALARKRILNKQMFGILQDKFHSLRSDFHADSLVMLVNAFSKLGFAEDSNLVPFYCAAAEQLNQEGWELSCRNICVTANAFAQAGVLHEQLFNSFSKVMPGIINQCDSRQLSLLAHAYVRLGLLSDELLHVIWRRVAALLDEYNWQGISLVLQAYTKSGAPDVHLLDTLGTRLLRAMQTFHSVLCVDGCLSASTPKAGVRLPQHSCGTVKPRRGRTLRGVGNLNTFPDSTSLACITYALAKGNCFHHLLLFCYMSKACQQSIELFRSAEVANLCMAFSEVFEHVQTRLLDLDRNLLHRLQDPELVTGAVASDLKADILQKQRRLSTNKTQDGYDGPKEGSSGHTLDHHLWGPDEYSRLSATKRICHEFFDICHERILTCDKRLGRDVGIHQVMKIVCAYGALRKTDCSTAIASLLRSRSTDLPSLTYLPLSRLMQALVQLAVCDDDLIGTLAAAQRKKTKQIRPVQD